MLEREFADFTGHLHRRDGVRLVNAEARTWLAAHRRDAPFDLIQIPLIDTSAATAAGALTLTENKLYTTEAWLEFLSRLNPNGLLAVSRWFDPDRHRGEFYRLLAIGAEALRQREPAATPSDHIVAATVNNILTFIISPTPFDDDRLARLQRVAGERGFSMIQSPGRDLDPIARMILEGRVDEAVLAAGGLDVTAPSDDRPYFFNMVGLAHLLDSNLPGDQHNWKNNVAIVALAVVFALTLLYAVLYVGLPLARLGLGTGRGTVPSSFHLGFFAAIGIGFMLLEIAQMQRLMIFLGHPMYALTVVLMTILLFSGIGSATVRSSDLGIRAVMQRVLPLIAVLALIGLATPMLTDAFRGGGTAVRVATSVGTLALMGFFMGMMFPLGMQLSARPHPDALPWFWGINGVASVFASIAAVLVSMEFGITATFWLGVGCYVVAGACAVAMVRRAGDADPRLAKAR